MLLRTLILFLWTALALAGCASTPPPTVSPIVPASYTPPASSPIATGATGQSDAYQLSDDEKGLSCNKLAGRISLRTLEIRDYEAKPKTSELSRAMQSLLSPIMSGPKIDANEASRHARDKAIIEAYKRRLAELKCPAAEAKSDTPRSSAKATAVE